jgi:hypothetical protein
MDTTSPTPAIDHQSATKGSDLRSRIANNLTSLKQMLAMTVDPR